jgi:Putative Actinobacterial Holin-X, holin superfamily III
MEQQVQIPRPAPPAPPADRPTGELVKELSEQLTRLVKDELRLAQAEMTRKGKQAGLGAGLLAGGGMAAWFGAGCLIACAIIAIAGVLAAWLAALIVGVALLLVAGAAALLGKGRLKRAAPPVPREALGNVKADVGEMKERAHR